MVIGDYMLDSYTKGVIQRISPEAPVPVVKALKEEFLAGGAGNVVLNLVALGAEVIAVGRIGADVSGKKLKDSLQHKSIDLSLLIEQEYFPTPVKNRVIASNQQVIRIDFEDNIPLTQKYEELVLELITQRLRDVDAVAISDYQKGFLTPTVLKHVIESCNRIGIPVIVDPKGNNFSKYAGVTLIKPNLHEAIMASGSEPSTPLEVMADQLLEITQAKGLIITRSEHGITLFEADRQRSDFPAKVREVKDVTGAGDTVLAALTFGLVNQLSIAEAIQLANTAAGIAVEKVGCAQVSLSELARRVLEGDSENKIFEGDHLFALIHALKEQPFVLVSIPTMSALNSALLKQLLQIKLQYKDQELVVYIRDHDPEHDLVMLLAAFSEINWIVVNGEDLKQLCTQIHPQAIYTLNASGVILGERRDPLSLEHLPFAMQLCNLS
ncbi:MAG: hldE [Chlamydiales bacterium]|jgi:D-beta-D-heptose 7-phosphate kinase/D-beta-D-heptose 1-phosphate adenosyltransferase|nr:hldE [Chlamydiales bacterium]